MHVTVYCIKFTEFQIPNIDDHLLHVFVFEFLKIVSLPPREMVYLLKIFTILVLLYHATAIGHNVGTRHMSGSPFHIQRQKRAGEYLFSGNASSFFHKDATKSTESCMSVSMNVMIFTAITAAATCAVSGVNDFFTEKIVNWIDKGRKIKELGKNTDVSVLARF